MNHFTYDNLQVVKLPGLSPVGVTSPRRYTITQADKTKEVILSIGPEFDHARLAAWRSRFLRDEITAVWQYGSEGWALHLHYRLNAGWLGGLAKFRLETVKNRLPALLEGIRWGDSQLFQALPQLDSAPIFVHFSTPQKQHNRVERWGKLGDYRQRPVNTPVAMGRLRPAVGAA